MSLRRWAGTTAGWFAVAWALRSLGAGLPELRAAAHDPQGLVDSAGTDALVLVVVTALVWACWAWGALGLLLSAASTAPGCTGRLATLLLAGVLPAGARRAAALALGIGLSTAAPVLLPPAVSPVVLMTTAAADDAGRSSGGVLVDWPTGPATDVVPDWPNAPASPGPPAAASPDWPAAPGEHVVLRGDCLWDIAADWLGRQHPGTPVTPREIQRAVQAWWQANAAVIGPDPDLLLPGQVLTPPR